VEILFVVSILVVALLFAEALSMSVGADSRDPIGDAHVRSITGGNH
jgi:hypothetical protein